MMFTSFLAGSLQTLLYGDFIYYFSLANTQQKTINFPL
jgi:hypothetical protein